MSFQQGVSGLNAASKNLEVIGNNVANSSTVGAKYSRAEFADVYARASVGDGTNIGLGTTVSTVAQQFKQGSLSTSDNPLDVAINGNGFFQLKDPNGNLQYSRNGQFEVDRSGYVVNAQGMQLLGHPINSLGSMVAGAAQPLQVPTAGIAPSATGNVKLEINLDSRATPTDTGATPIVDFANDKTYNNATSLTVYDAKGQSVSLSYFFQKASSDTWNMYASANGEVVNPDAAGNPQALAVLSFPASGGAPTSPASPLLIDVPATGTANGTGTQPITGLKIDITKMTQFAAVFGPTDVSQDGFPAGKLSGVTVQSDGTLVASYSSGQSAPIARIEMANFRNPQGLLPLGGNGWAATHASGDAVLGVPGGGNLGTLQAKALEESNVDLTGELVNMMVAQRVYQANAQTIKTQDQVMQTLVNLR